MFNFRTVYGHVGGRVWSRGCVQCSIMDTSLESFSRVLVECHRYYEQDNTWHACVGTARGQQYPQLPKNLSTSHRNRPSTVTGFAVEAKTYLRVNDPGLHNTNCTSPQQPRMHSRGWVYVLQRVDTLHSHSLCGSVQYRRTVLVRRLCVPGTLLQHTIEVARPRTVAGLLYSVSYGLTRVTVEVHHPLKLITPRQSPAYTKGGLESLNFLH